MKFEYVGPFKEGPQSPLLEITTSSLIMDTSGGDIPQFIAT